MTKVSFLQSGATASHQTLLLECIILRAKVSRGQVIDCKDISLAHHPTAVASNGIRASVIRAKDIITDCPACSLVIRGFIIRKHSEAV